MFSSIFIPHTCQYLCIAETPRRQRVVAKKYPTQLHTMQGGVCIERGDTPNDVTMTTHNMKRFLTDYVETTLFCPSREFKE